MIFFPLYLRRVQIWSWPLCITALTLQRQPVLVLFGASGAWIKADILSLYLSSFNHSNKCKCIRQFARSCKTAFWSYIDSSTYVCIILQFSYQKSKIRIKKNAWGKNKNIDSEIWCTNQELKFLHKAKLNISRLTSKKGSGPRYISKSTLVRNFIHCSSCCACWAERRVIQSQRCVTLEAFTTRKLIRVKNYWSEIDENWGTLYCHDSLICIFRSISQDKFSLFMEVRRQGKPLDELGRKTTLVFDVLDSNTFVD